MWYDAQPGIEPSEIQTFVTEPRYAPDVLMRGDPAFTRISIILPCFNQAAYIERTLLSIFNQNYPNFELIVLDAGSTDGTVDVLSRYQEYFSYFRSAPDHGQAAAINEGFRRASGQLVGWQNSDDLYLPGFFHRIDQAFRQYPDADIVFSNACICDVNDRPLRATRFVPLEHGYLSHVDWNITSQVAFLRRRFLEDIGPMGENWIVSFDWEWFMRVEEKAQRSVLIKALGGAYRMNPEAKFAVFPQERRDQIEFEIMMLHKIAFRPGITFRRQFIWRKRWLRFLRAVHEIILYGKFPPGIRQFYIRLQGRRGHQLLGF